MATHVEASERQASESLLGQRRAVAWGFLWAALMLLLLGSWINIRELEQGFFLYGPLFLLALAALVIGIREWRRSSPARADAERIQADTTWRRGIAFILYLGALVLLVLAAILAYGERLSAFGEVATMVVLATISGLTGFVLSKSSEQSVARGIFEALLHRRRQIVLVLFGTAVVFGLWAVGLYYNVGIIPEALAVGALAIAYGVIALWQASIPNEDATPFTMRLVVLSVGGLTGLVIAVATVWRLWQWWPAIFPIGQPMAASEGLWRLWLCVYIELAALALLFGSLMLARGDIRENVVVRRLLYGYNAFLTGLLMLAVLSLANVVVALTWAQTYEWSEDRGLYSLSSKSQSLLESLREPVRAYVLMPHGYYHPYVDLRTLLNNGQQHTRMLQVDYISPDRESIRYLKLAEKYPAIESDGGFDPMGGGLRGGVLLVYGPEAEKGKSVWVPARDLEDRMPDQRGRTVTQFKGEDVIMTQLRMLVDQENRPKVYFTQGNGELNLRDTSREITLQAQLRGDERGGAGLLLQRLKKDNYDVRGLLWGTMNPDVDTELFSFTKKDAADKHRIPADAKLLILAHPIKPYSAEEVESFEQFMGSGGTLILLTNYIPLRDGQPLKTGLEDFLNKYNVDLTNEYAFRVLTERRPNAYELVARVPSESQNPVAVNFRGRDFPVGGFLPKDLGSARIVRPLTNPGEYQAEPFLQIQSPTETDYWAETLNYAGTHPIETAFNYVTLLERTGKLAGKKTTEPLPVAVAVMDRERKPRMVVFGDGRFASNYYVNFRVPYYDMLTSTIEWLANRPANIGISPRESRKFEVTLNPAEQSRLVWLPLGLMVLGFVGLGTGIWMVRRR